MSDAQNRIGPRPPGGAGVTRFATRGDHRLSYESGGAADGTPVLALHDLLADRGQLRALADVLPMGAFRLMLADARGHGASPMISGGAYPVRELTADALAVLDAEGLAAVHIAAVGWGAGIALGLAALAPERVSALVLVEPYLPLLRDEGSHVATLRDAASAAAKGQVDSALDLYFGARLGSDWRDQFAKPRLGAMRRAAGSLGPLLMGSLDAALDRITIAAVAAPVTILLGERATPAARVGAEALQEIQPVWRHTTGRVPGALGAAPGEGWMPAIAGALMPRWDGERMIPGTS